MPIPTVLHNQHAARSLKRGFDKVADLLALTLGPTGGHVVSAHNIDGRPEILTDAATIARRILQLPDRAEDVGAMLARNLAWRMQTRAGDGSATAAVLAQALLDEGHRLAAVGANVVALRRGIDRGARAALAALQAQARPVVNQDDLTLIAYGVTFDADLSRVLGEMVYRLGADGYITVEDYVAPYLAREYLDGGRWAGRYASPYFITDVAAQRAVLDGCQVALAAMTVERADDVQPLLELAARLEGQPLVLMAESIQGAALAALVLNHQRGAARLLGINLSNPPARRLADFEDLAVLTGATVLSPDVGRPLSRVTGRDLGAARQVSASADEVIVVGDGGQAARIQQQVAVLQTRAARLPETDDERAFLRQRQARLAGQTGTLKIGAYTEAERAIIRQRAEKGLRTLPLALREGVAWGGGVAYLNCIPAVQAVAAEGDEAWGVAMVARALEAPFRRIARNAGVAAPAAVLAEAQRRGSEFGYHAEIDEVVSFEEEGIYDAVGVLRQALETAVSGTVMALTIDTVVLHRTPKTELEP